METLTDKRTTYINRLEIMTNESLIAELEKIAVRIHAHGYGGDEATKDMQELARTELMKRL